VTDHADHPARPVSLSVPVLNETGRNRRLLEVSGTTAGPQLRPQQLTFSRGMAGSVSVRWGPGRRAEEVSPQLATYRDNYFRRRRRPSPGRVAPG
jgi:hypothetical protein